MVISVCPRFAGRKPGCFSYPAFLAQEKPSVYGCTRKGRKRVIIELKEISGKYAKREIENDVLSTFPNVKEKL
jgi:hypothetical protein